MKFKETELLPGVVIDCEDPKMLGRVKVTVPGLFDDSEMSKEGMPWVYPITMHGYQGFSKIQEGCKVWVFKQEGNYKEFWYMPMFELNKDTRDIVADYDEPDVIISRSAGANSVYIYYTDKQGIMLKLGDNSFINMKADGEIIAKSGEGQVSIRSGKVYIGTDQAKQQAILGNNLDKVLGQLASDLANAATVASGSPYTTPLNAPLQQASANLQQGIGKNILCDATIVS